MNLFRAVNPLEAAVNKATDENLTTENWELILGVCDKVDSDLQDGAKNAIAAIQKRLGHRNANVQLFSLSLVEALSKNCGSKVHREIASRSFCQALVRLTNDRTVHVKTKARISELLKEWTDSFQRDPSLGIVAETYRSMKNQGGIIEPPSRPLKKEITAEDKRREEEELQMALAISLSETRIDRRHEVDQGPNEYTLPSVVTTSRVKALYDFTASEAGELTFHRGDIITVIESAYKDWWRGSLHGIIGIFPTNYVENLPEPTTADLMREAEEETKVFAEAKNVEKLLTILSQNDPSLADNEQLQNLYHTTLAIRPKLVRLIEKYSTKKDDLIMLNDKFARARKDYDSLMEASLSRYSYNRQPNYGESQPVTYYNAPR